VIVQELGENPILYLYRDKSLRKAGSDDIKEAVFEHLKTNKFNVKARRTLESGKRDGEFYKKFKAIVISEDVEADNEEVLDILSGSANLPVLNMKSFTYPNMDGWGNPDNGTIDTLSMNGARIFVQRDDHPIFSTWKHPVDTLTILDFKKLKEAGLNSVMPIQVKMEDSYCLATAYTRNIDPQLAPEEAYYLDGEEQTIIHEIPASKRNGQKYICFPLSRKSTDYLSNDGKNLFKNIMEYLLTGTAVAWEPATLKIKRFAIDEVEAVIDETSSTISMSMDAKLYKELDSLVAAKPKITLSEPDHSFVNPSSGQKVNLKLSMYVPYTFVVSDYIRRHAYEFMLTLTYSQGIEEAYVVGEWVVIYDIYGRKVTTTNENIYTMDLPQGIYIAVTAGGQAIKMMK
jgi:hypothetical protein